MESVQLLDLWSVSGNLRAVMVISSLGQCVLCQHHYITITLDSSGFPINVLYDFNINVDKPLCGNMVYMIACSLTCLKWHLQLVEKVFDFHKILIFCQHLSLKIHDSIYGQFHNYINPTLKISNLQVKVNTATSCQKNVWI